jgi:superfamily II RNA helicase
MVKICSYNYPKSHEEEYRNYYNDYSYELHDFQKWCVEGIVTGNHVLICSPTGSGKTFGGEFSVNYFHSKGKKVIYCSPIKALSNEKFYAFTQKYPHISVGILTGDLRCNPDADVLIMTTEIFLNKLYQIKSLSLTLNSSVSFEMDIENELGCVVFDEIHFINEESRGSIWEQSIMLLPSHIQMVGLSATLDDPENFAFWLETKGDVSKPVNKEVYLTRKLIRAVPLIHYSFITVTSTANKYIRDKSTQEEIKKIINKPHIIQDEKGVFNDTNYQNINKTLKLFEKNDIRVKRQFVLNKVSEYLVQNEMLPALCYVFSRKQLEVCAEELTTNLLEFDSKIPYTIDRECEQIIRKLPNYQEYLNLPEYINTVKLLRKGVGMHHAGLMPILREMVELLFARGFIKILFCTETMSVGINLPVKTTIFTDIYKFNGEINRLLYSHEYSQAGGRAGRLGLDKIGHIIHLNNLFRDVDSVSYKQMMNGKPQTLTSKFKISYNLLLNLLDIGDNNLVEFASKSMITNYLNGQMKELCSKMTNLESELDKGIQNLNTSIDIIREYNELIKNKSNVVNKKRKEIERQIKLIEDSNKFLSRDKATYDKFSLKDSELKHFQNQYNSLNSYFKSGVDIVLNLLKEEEFVESNQTLLELNNNNIKLTFLGRIAAQIREIHCLVFAKLLQDKSFDNLSPKQLVSIFSCFTNIRVLDDFKDYTPKCDDKIVNSNILQIVNLYNSYKTKELSREINTGFDYEIHYDLLNYTEKWCDSENVEDCKVILQEMGEKKQIFLGEFVKALLKINNISSEFEKIAEMTGNILLLSNLKKIPNMTLKYVVTNQSLYV